MIGMCRMSRTIHGWRPPDPDGSGRPGDQEHLGRADSPAGSALNSGTDDDVAYTTSSGCSIANAIARAIALWLQRDLSHLLLNLRLTPASVIGSAKLVPTNPGEIPSSS